jgi:TrmH family RNA methyltransferase
MKAISSRDNPEYRELQRLMRSAAERRDAGMALLEGVHLLEAYRDAFGAARMKVVVRASHSQHGEIEAWLRTAGHALVLGDALFDSITQVETSSGVLALVPIPDADAVRAPTDSFSILLDGVQDPGNLGSILRSAAAAGGSSAYLSTHCADPWSPKSLRGGMGGQFVLRIFDREDLIRTARGFGGRLVALEAHATESLFDADLRDASLAFVLGSEGGGISPALSELVRDRVKIPMTPGIESLNVGAAAAVCFYEWRRQRGRW